MKAPAAVPLLAFLLITSAAYAQQTTASPSADACGANAANYMVKHDAAAFSPQQVPAGKALVYVIETMLDYPFVTKKVNIGLDGTWLGATDADTYMSFTIEPGVHHLCAVYQGHAEGMDEEGRTLLLHLDAEPGKIYYLRYHALFLKDSPGIAFFDKVDDDEGLFLLQRSSHADSALKK